LLENMVIFLALAGPEGILMGVVGYGLLGVRRSLRHYLAVGAVVGLASIVFREILPAGFHVPLVLVVFCFMSVRLLHVSWKTTVIACFVSALLINLGQIAVAFPLLDVFGLSLQDTFDSLLYHLAFGWLGDTLLVVGAVVSVLADIVILKVPEAERSVTQKR